MEKENARNTRVRANIASHVATPHQFRAHGSAGLSLPVSAEALCKGLEFWVKAHAVHLHQTDVFG